MEGTLNIMRNSKAIHRQTKTARPNLWIWAGLTEAALIALAASYFSFVRPASSTAYPAEISVAEAVAKREAGAFILDVRQLEEWNEVHIPDATLIPLGELAARVGELPRDQEIVVVCRSGNRSAMGRDILRAAGFTQVTSMAGGVPGWQAAGHPIATGP
jgi:rhodanese-related sulfurtransferase